MKSIWLWIKHIRTSELCFFFAAGAQGTPCWAENGWDQWHRHQTTGLQKEKIPADGYQLSRGSVQRRSWYEQCVWKRKPRYINHLLAMGKQKDVLEHSHTWYLSLLCAGNRWYVTSPSERFLLGSNATLELTGVMFRVHFPPTFQSTYGLGRSI